ncbi:MAG: hypothetical protein WBB39_01240 [Candidatus Saccharimonadales bacterium]
MTKHYQPPHLLLHNLIGALSYYGTTVRVLLFGFLLALAVTLGVTSGGLNASKSFENFVYVLASFLLLDAGYVTIARVLPISTERFDQGLFLVLLFAVAGVIIWPYFAVGSGLVLLSAKAVFLFALFVLALRMVLGFFVGHRVK